MATHLLTVGHEFEGFIVERLLGVGGFGAVYLATHKSITIPTESGPIPWKVAIKELTNDKHIARFLAEVGILIPLSAAIPELTKIYSFHEKQGHAFFIMEYVPGGTLADIANKRQTQLPEGQLIEIGSTLANVLHRMHTFTPGVIHRDMKPENVKVGFKGMTIETSVLDLGVAAVIQPGQVAKHEVVGTMIFAGPHQLRGEAPAPFMDQHSLGTTLFYCMMPISWKLDDKIPPFPFESWKSATERDAILRQYNKGFVDAIEQAHGYLPDHWDPMVKMEEMLALSTYSDHLKTVVRKMMSYHPHEKYRDLDEVEKALKGNNPAGLQAQTMSGGIGPPPISKSGSKGPIKSTSTSGAFLPFGRKKPNN